MRTMELFRRWGWADRVREVAPLPVEWSNAVSFCVTLTGQEITRFDHCFGLYPDRVDFASELGQQIPQPFVELVLREAVQARPGCTSMLGWRVTDLVQHTDGVHLTIADESNRSAQLEASYVLGCDGAQGMTRQAIGAKYVGSADQRSNLGMVFRSADLWPLVSHRPAVHYWIVHPGNPALMGRLDLDDRWWMIALGVQPDDVDPTKLIRGAVGAAVDVEMVSTDPWTAKMLVADAYRQRRVFLVGDAAHLNPPFGGHGFNTGIGDAVNIGWKIAAVVKGWGGDDLLESYEAERRPIAVQTIDAAQANMRVLAGDLYDNPDVSQWTDEDLRFIAGRTQATKDAEFHSLGLVLGYSYDASPVIPDAPPRSETLDVTEFQPNAEPGSRLPHQWLRDGSSIYDTVGPNFVLVSSTSAKGDAERFSDEAAERHMPLKVLTVDDGATVTDYGVGLILVRPDHHIAWRGATCPNPGEILDTARGACAGR